MQRRKFFQLLGNFGAPSLVGRASTLRSRGPRDLPVLDANIAGFAYYEGGTVVDHIAAGNALTFRRQPDNPHDRRVIEIFWNEHKIGYVPRSHNRALCQLLDDGEAERWEPLFFTARV